MDQGHQGHYMRVISNSSTLRVEFPGAIYRVMNRSDRREEIFREDQDRGGFPGFS